MQEAANVSVFTIVLVEALAAEHGAGFVGDFVLVMTLVTVLGVHEAISLLVTVDVAALRAVLGVDGETI